MSPNLNKFMNDKTRVDVSGFVKSFGNTIPYLDSPQEAE
jgi:hypothetical protein